MVVIGFKGNVFSVDIRALPPADELYLPNLFSQRYSK